MYLDDVLKSSNRRPGRRPRIVDVGAGTGLCSLALASIGSFDILSTDLDLIVDGVLARNIAANRSTLNCNSASDQARVETKVLDWFQPPENWQWNHSNDDNEADEPLGPPFDFVVSADTIYVPELIQPLLRTLRALSTTESSPSFASVPVYVALEVRDPALVAEFLRSAEEDWDFKSARVDHGKLKRLVESKESGLGWEDESAWEGVEIWKLKSRKPRAKKNTRWKKDDGDGKGDNQG